MHKNLNFYSENLIQRANELYFDFMNEKYHNSRPETFEQEKARWESLATESLTEFYKLKQKPIKIADLGTGTGFVPLRLAPLLRKEDTFVCSDISGGILAAAKQNIEKSNFHCKFQFIKIENKIPLKLPFENQSLDVITMNAVLHHIKNVDNFLFEIDRILKHGGLIFIGHEPNRYFFDNKFLYLQSNILDIIFNPQIFIYKTFKKIHLDKTIKYIYYLINNKKKKLLLEHEEVLKKTSEVLIKEKLITKPISAEEINKIIDIQTFGFKPDSLFAKFTNYKILNFETYNHILWVSIKHRNNWLIRKYEDLLLKKYPKGGATFFIILKKI